MSEFDYPTLHKVYKLVWNEFLISTQDVADSLFEGDTEIAEYFLNQLVDDFELISSRSDDSWMAEPNYDHIDEDQADQLALEAFGSIEPEANESVANENRTVIEENNTPKQYPHPDRALENFKELAENAPSEAGRAFWQAKLGELTAS